MTAAESLKASAQAAIDVRRDYLIGIAESIRRNPEAGFRENFASNLVYESLAEIGVEGLMRVAVTGVRGKIRGGNHGPTVAILGELDALPMPRAVDADPSAGQRYAHACGHNCQVAMMLGAAHALALPEIRRALCGDVALMGVPAEEFVDLAERLRLKERGGIRFMSGKQEFIRLGAFDDVDMAMMAHASSSAEDAKFSLGGASNAHVGKRARFLGRASHAGSAPHRGINALQAALVALHAINTQRETFEERDVVRVHGILTHEGGAANATPARVDYEGRVRGRSMEAVARAADKVDRCLRAGALALGATAEIATIPGYFPLLNDTTMSRTFRVNAERLVGVASVVDLAGEAPRGGSTDMGDLSRVMPAIHPYTGGCAGAGHSDDFRVVDYEQAVIRPAKALAMTAIDLLTNGAALAKETIERSRADMTKRSYLAFQEAQAREETYPA